jgi:dipeptidyl aminopeptidase/acylaminoacyl peptidase
MDRANGDAIRLFRGRVRGTVQAVALDPGLEPHNLVWLDSTRLLVSAEQEIRSAEKTRKRLDWWLVSPATAPRNVSHDLASPPAELTLVPQQRAFVGVAGEALWSLDGVSTTWSNLTANFEPKVVKIVWPDVRFRRAQAGVPLDSVIISAHQGTTTNLYRVDIMSGETRLLARPSEHALLVAYRPEADQALFVADEPTGTFLTVTQGATKRPLVEANTFMRDLVQGEIRAIEYSGLDGDNLKGWLVLPTDYESGKRYPLVTWVYEGYMASETPPWYAQFGGTYLTPQLLAARGYAVLIPSMPLISKLGEPGDRYMELTKGVLPAVDKVIQLGIADSQRLGVMGHSFGGFSTYGLVTATHRFKAAVALAGPADFISTYGAFDPRHRYEPDARDANVLLDSSETGQIGMANPPWKDVERYIRNSPLFYADRVQTPLLIVQGDMDMVPIAQGEEFFTALYRQGKRARFVRYWGEGHTFTSPANIRAMWSQVFAWFDEFLSAPATTHTSHTSTQPLQQP